MPASRRFVDLGTDERKSLFAQHVATYVPLAHHIKRILGERPIRRAPTLRFRDELEDPCRKWMRRTPCVP